ncbi:MAG: hypothetical protein Q7J03_06220 [Methanoregula sp.]|nr:hypothetical protein [Methanoregula sp.]
MAGKNSSPRKDNELALSEVIGFIMLLGVLVTAMAIWMMYVVPVTGREDEITQMNVVRDRFTDYKISLDSLWINSPSGAAWSQSGVTLSTSFNLGTGGGNTEASGLFLPMLKPIASSATLSVKNNGDTMNISSLGGPTNMNVNNSMGILEYQSQNYYWLQQRYYYQTGGVFLAQDYGSTTRVSPPISIVNSSKGTASMNAFTGTVVIAPITLDGGASIGGNGPVRVDSRLKTLSPQLGPEKKYWVNISVKVQDYTTAQMWNATFNDAVSNGGITNKSWYKSGTSSAGVTPATAYMRVIGPYNDETNPDVWLTIHPAEYAVTFNNIASGLT